MLVFKNGCTFLDTFSTETLGLCLLFLNLGRLGVYLTYTAQQKWNFMTSEARSWKTMRFLSYLLGYLLSEIWTTIWEAHHAGETMFWSTKPAKPSSLVIPAMVPDMWVKLSWSLQASHWPGEYHWVTSFGNRGGVGMKPLALDHKHETLRTAVRGPALPTISSQWSA